MRQFLSFVLLGFLIFAFSPGVFAKSHPFGWQDMFGMVRLSDPQPSPDGQWVLFGRKAFDLEKNKGNSDLAMVSVDGRKTRRLTRQESSEWNGRWLPDGSAVLFLSTRGGCAQIWKLPMEGGEPSQITDLPLDIDGFELSPNGAKVLFWAGVFPDCSTLACTADRLKKKEENPMSAMVFENLFIRHWDTWNDGRRNHVFAMDLGGEKRIDLMAGMDQDAPTKPWGGGDEVAWAPDGKTVVFVSKPSKGEAWHTNSEIYSVGADGKKKPFLLTGHNPAWDTAPAFSPDGKTLAFLAMDRPGYEADRFSLVLMDMGSGKRRKLTADWDRSVREFVWSKDAKTIFLTAAEHARIKVFSVNVDSGKVRTLVSQGSNRSPKITKDGKLVFLQDRLTHPKEVIVYDPGSRKTTQISRINAKHLKTVRMSQPEDFWFEHDGFRMHGWLLKPVGFQKGKKYPLAFLVHGGPQGNWGDDFHYRWNPQFYAGAGYVVVAVNPRGSTSFGQKFTDAIRGDYGPGPYSDLMAGLQTALDRYSFIDQRRMCALGASYGGYMMNWIAGQKHPFQCLVNHDGDFDPRSFYFSTEELWFPEWDMLGTPWENPQVYERNSPRNYVKNWKTPMLVIQGAKDFRISESESFSTFSVLQRLGIPSKLLYFPDENHWVLKPQNSKFWHDSVLSWIDRWTKTKR